MLAICPELGGSNDHASPSSSITAESLLSDTRQLGEPEIVDTLKVDKLGSSIVVCRYYLAYSAGEYFLKVSLHKHLRGWALNAIAYSQNATDIMNGY